MAEQATTTAETQTAHHGGSSGMPQLDPSSFASQLFWLVITFAVLYGFLVRHVLPRIQSVIENRQAQISADLAAAEKSKEEAASAREVFEKEISTARSKAFLLIQDAQSEIDAMFVKSNHKLEQKLAKELTEAEAAMTAQTQKTARDMQPVIEEVSTMIVEMLTRKKPASGSVSKAVTQAMKG